ncbi:hypothetical protein B0H14DRAFT_2817467 [Mycena olivaceomarginata]|nr:hypothetical protein B0H14DRAFT_2817467 [Mycena olivaceomarginata]
MSSSVAEASSYNSPEDSGVGSVFLQHPDAGVGIIVDDWRSIAEVPPGRWAELLGTVAEAKKSLKEHGGGTWSRPHWVSCSIDVFYALGPGETKEELITFQLTGHEVDEEEPDEILRYANGEQMIVPEIPSPLVTLEFSISTLKKDLLPKHDYSRHPDPISKNMQELWKAVGSMTTMKCTFFFKEEETFQR